MGARILFSTAILVFLLSFLPGGAWGQAASAQEEQPPAAATDTVATSAASDTLVIPAATDTVPAPAAESAPSGKEPSDEEKRRRMKELIQLKGYWYSKLRSFSASGNEYRFESATGLATFGNKLEQGTDLTLLFKFGKNLTLDGAVYDMPYQERRMKFGATTGNLKATMGDFTATINGGAFGGFSKKIVGAMFEYNTNRASLSFVTSKPKSVTKSESFRGRNIKGPYDLKGVDLIPESVIIRKNGEFLSPDKYILEPFQGDITFKEIVTPDELITVTYEQTFQVSLDTGNITGISGGFKSKSGKWSWQAARLQQEAARSVSTGIESVSGETPVVTGPDAFGRYVLQLEKIANTGGRPSLLVRFGNDPFNTTETITKNDIPLEYPNDYNVPSATDTATSLTRGTDLAFRAAGKFVLNAPPQAGDVFKVSYNYYPAASVQCYSNEMLPVDVDGTAHFTNRTVYYGTEVLVGCRSDDPLNCDDFPKLARHDTLNGYEIVENTNTIYLRGTAAQYLYVKAETYCVYPAFIPTGSLYDKSLTSFTASYNPSASLKMQLDYAMSEADVSAKPLSVYGSVVAAFATDTACPSPVRPDPCAVRLADTDITPDTERVYFNDVTTAANTKTRYTDYNIDYDTGTLNFITKIPANTVVIADYSRQPPELGVMSGKIMRLTSAYAKPRLKLNHSMQRADTFFTSIAGESNLEVKNDTLTGEYALTQRLKFGFDLFSQLTALDTLGVNHQANDRVRYEVQYSSPRIKALRLFNQKRTLTDDYAVSRIDTAETSRGFAIAVPAPFIKNLDLTFDTKKDTRSNRSAVAPSPDSDDVARNLGLSWKYHKLDVGARFGSSLRSSTDYTGAPSSITTASKNVDLKYDFNFLRAALNLDSQRTSDSTPGGEGSRVESSRLSVDTRPFWRVQSFRIAHSRQDRPALNSPSTSSTSTSYSAPIRISPDLMLTTTYIVTSSTVGGSSTTGSAGSNYSLEYRPPGRPYHVIYSIQKSNTTSSSDTGASSGSSTTRNQLTATYTPAPAWTHNASYQTEAGGGGAGSSSSSSTLGYTARFTPSERKSYFLTYNLTRRAGALSEKFTTYNFGLNYLISKILTWNFSWKRSSYQSGGRPSDGFTGDLMETEVRATF